MLAHQPEGLFEWINTHDRLAWLCGLPPSAVVGLDTEFIRQGCYWPKVCLIQWIDPRGIFLIDPLSPHITAWSSFLQALTVCTLVVHDPQQDFEGLVWLARQAQITLAPLRIFDTQRAAAQKGWGRSLSYQALVQRISGFVLDKKLRCTSWDQRPLTKAQQAYAQADVAYLLDLFTLLADMDKAYRDMDAAALSAEHIASRFSLRCMPLEAQIRARHLLTWREQQAQERNVPREKIMRTPLLLRLAQRSS